MVTPGGLARGRRLRVHHDGVQPGWRPKAAAAQSLTFTNGSSATARSRSTGSVTCRTCHSAPARPIVTSDGIVAGSGVLWNIARTGLTNSANLVAYGAVPVAGTGADPAGNLPVLWKASIGNSTKFNPPLAYDGRIYVGNYDGQILAFGPRSGASPLDRWCRRSQDTVLGSTSPDDGHVHSLGQRERHRSVDQHATSGASGAFTTPPLAAPVQLTSRGQLPVPVTLRSAACRRAAGHLDVDDQPRDRLGAGQRPRNTRGWPDRRDTASLNFGLQPIGGDAVDATVSFQNTSSSSVTVDSVNIESGSPAPFSIGILPEPLPTVAPKGTLSVPVVFTPPGTSGDFVQNFDDQLVLTTSAGKTTVPLEGSAAPSPQITISALQLDVGTVAIGQSGIVSFTVGNQGGTPLTITKSKPPTRAWLHSAHLATGGDGDPAHAKEIETVRFAPTRAGLASATWVINGNDTSGVQTITFTGTGAREQLIPSPLRPGWLLSGQATLADRYLQLTSTTPNSAGAAFWKTPVSPSGLRASFVASFAGGTAGDGLTFALAAANVVPSRPGAAVRASVSPGSTPWRWPSRRTRAATPSEWSSRPLGPGPSSGRKIVSTIPALRTSPAPGDHNVSQDVMTVAVDGFTVLAQSVTCRRLSTSVSPVGPARAPITS